MRGNLMSIVQRKEINSSIASRAPAGAGQAHRRWRKEFVLRATKEQGEGVNECAPALRSECARGGRSDVSCLDRDFHSVILPGPLKCTRTRQLYRWSAERRTAAFEKDS